MRVFVTGGSGFIGMRLVSALLREGNEVVCLSRSGQSSARLAAMGAEVLSGDLTDANSVRSSLIEATPSHVAHLAAEMATQRDTTRIEEVNVRGTQALLTACRELDELQSFLFVSSVIRGDAKGQTLTESDDIPSSTAYGASKAQGDALLLEAFQNWQLPAVILRPSHVYGSGGWLEQVVCDRYFRIPGKGDNLWDVVHVDDVVSACSTLLASGPKIAGEVFHVVDDEPLTMKEFFDHVASAMARKPYGHAPVWLAKLLRGAGPVDAVVRSARSSNAKLKELGWSPKYPRSSDCLADVISEILSAQNDGT